MTEFKNLWIFRESGKFPKTPKNALETSKPLRPMYETLGLAMKAAGNSWKNMSYAVVPARTDSLIDAGNGQYFSTSKIHLGKGYMSLDDAIEYAKKNEIALK